LAQQVKVVNKQHVKQIEFPSINESKVVPIVNNTNSVDNHMKVEEGGGSTKVNSVVIDANTTTSSSIPPSKTRGFVKIGTISYNKKV